MKKLFGLLPGLIGGLLSVLFLNELFKWFIASCLSINYSGTFFSALLIVIAPLMFSLIMIELFSYILKKIEKDFFRINVIIYILINIGFLIFNVLLGIFALILKSNYSNDWARFLVASGYSYNEKLVFMLFVMVILFTYLNYTTKKMKHFIPIIKNLE